MATIEVRVCDRCSSPIKGEPRDVERLTRGHGIGDDGEDVGPVTFEICAKCGDEFDKWIKREHRRRVAKDT